MKMKLNRRKHGFTLVEIMIVVAIIGLLAAIGVPNYLGARQRTQTNSCINNLRQIDGAKQQWAMECGKNGTDTPGASDLQPYLGRGAAGSTSGTYCPLVTPGPLAGYDINDVITHPACQHEDPVNHPAVLN
jgi:prepilin-type N-terminal cleavage/methylation domain-containing protein